MKRYITLGIILASMLFLSGCWDALEIEDQFLVWAMGWDVAEAEPRVDDEEANKPGSNKGFKIINLSGSIKENKPKLLVSLTSPSTTEGAPEPFTAVTSTGYSIEQAISNIQTDLFRFIELGHLRILIISEAMAKKGILQHLDSLGRNPRVGRDMIIAIIKGNITSVWEIKNPGNPLPGDYVVKLIKTNSEFDQSINTTFRDFFEAISEEGMEPVAPYLIVNKDKLYISANNLAVFKQDKLVGVIGDSGLKYYLILTNRSNEGTITLGNATLPEDNAITFIYRRASTKVKTKIIDDKPHIYLTVSAEGDILEYTSTLPTRDAKTIQTAEKALSVAVKGEMLKLLDICQKDFKSDIFGFGSYFRALHSRWWNAHNWEEEFPDAVVHIKVEINIRRIGIES